MYPPTTEIYTLSLHDALPISVEQRGLFQLSVLYPDGRDLFSGRVRGAKPGQPLGPVGMVSPARAGVFLPDRDYRKNRSEEHTSELQSRQYLVCRLLLEKKNTP